MRSNRYFVAVRSSTEDSCGHDHARLAVAFDCAREFGPLWDEVYCVEIRPAGRVPLAVSKVKHPARKRATRRP